ncbi:sensor domain-containing phosphodiesterase [Marinobacter piscensis]|uniref:sensor domain-containing phosphodiesterase n=1 Tax=Marinobacter piscensis TaxID=1562308 RepID=UPI00119D92E6|nr:GGDEF and EAL domain-containing protein [Marinobacter piscensis]
MSDTDTENKRLASLKRLGLLDTPPEERFERLTRIAQQHYQVRTALFTLLDDDRQWFKSRQGLDVAETPRSVAFCDHTIRQDQVFIVENASQDPRFRNNPFVLENPGVRFYAGVPVREPSGFKIGTLCIIDDKPRQFGEKDLDVLRTLAVMVEDELERSWLRSDNSEQVSVSHLNRAIHQAQNVFLTSDNERSAFEYMLNDLLALTGSQFGFIGEILYDDKGSPFLKVGAITNIAWNPEAQALYQEVERQGMIFRNLDNILGKSMLTGDLVISNNLPEDPRRGGLPVGHPAINTYIGIPVYSGTTLLGLIGLANRSEGYNRSLADELAPLSQTLGHLIERKRLYEEQRTHRKDIELATHYDALTGLPNRYLLTQLLEQELFEAELRNGQVSVCLIDLDGFKAINDKHGHLVGDAVLKSVADRLKVAVKPHDIIARSGGDEFVLILRDVADERAYAGILDAMRRPINFQHHVLQVSGSMGVTLYPEDDVSTDLLLRHADQAMYAAKETGKNGFKIFDLEYHSSRKARWRVLEQIGDGLNQGQMELYYQPKICFRSRTVDGFEALIRWNHPEEGLLAPGDFLQHIEYTEYARTLGNFVIREAVKQILAFSHQGLPYTLSINLSPSHFLCREFRHDLADALEDCPRELRARLILEILETTTMDNTDAVQENLKACRELGVDISLDDFGTGYSSLDYFRRLPAQEIKIDQSFVKDMLEDTDDRMIVSAIVSLTKSFNRRLVAEGIENADVEKKLIQLGCDLGQGFFYSKPLPLPDALQWAENFRWENR